MHSMIELEGPVERDRSCPPSPLSAGVLTTEYFCSRFLNRVQTPSSFWPELVGAQQPAGKRADQGEGWLKWSLRQGADRRVSATKPRCCADGPGASDRARGEAVPPDRTGADQTRARFGPIDRKRGRRSGGAPAARCSLHVP